MTSAACFPSPGTGALIGQVQFLSQVPLFPFSASPPVSLRVSSISGFRGGSLYIKGSTLVSIAVSFNFFCGLAPRPLRQLYVINVPLSSYPNRCKILAPSRTCFSLLPARSLTQTASDVFPLLQVGRIGGRNASVAMSTFSAGFRWSRFQLGLSLREANQRRASKKKADNSDMENDTDGRAANSTTLECSYDDVAPSLETLGTCALVLAGVFMARRLLILVLSIFIHRDCPASLLFPAWCVGVWGGAAVEDAGKEGREMMTRERTGGGKPGRRREERR